MSIQKIRGVIREKMKSLLDMLSLRRLWESQMYREVTVELKPGQGCSGICGDAAIHLGRRRDYRGWKQTEERYQANSTGSEKPRREL